MRLNRAELRKVRAAASREGYPIDDFLAVAAVRAALAPPPPPGAESASLLSATRALALRVARLSERMEGSAETAAEAEAIVEQSLDLCAMAYEAEGRSREPAPGAAAEPSAA